MGKMRSIRKKPAAVHLKIKYYFDGYKGLEIFYTSFFDQKGENKGKHTMNQREQNSLAVRLNKQINLWKGDQL